jgi:quinol monooxygenase YgiN
MIIVTATLRARPESFDDVLRVCSEHVRRSRTEPGCISHAVFRDTEDPLRLQFVERWTDMALLQTHLALPELNAMLAEISALASEPPSIQLYEASEIVER